MNVSFESLPEEARVWIYPCNRSLTDDEIKNVEVRCEEFLTDWTAHGSQLEAAFKIEHKRFIILGLNEESQNASGCSIDASVHFIQTLERDFDIVLLDKLNVTFKQGNFFAYKPLAEFKKMAKDKAVTKKTIVFNNLVLNKKELETLWEVPASDSWHERFF